MINITSFPIPTKTLSSLAAGDGILSLFNGGLGADQSSAAANSIPVYPGAGGAAVPITLSSIFASPGAIGGSTPAAGAFTTLSATGAVTLTNATFNLPATSPQFYMGDFGVANTPGFQFRSSTSVSSYDSWLRATGGSGSDGSGAVQILGSFYINPVAATTQQGILVTQSGPTSFALGSNPLVYNQITVTGDQTGLTGSTYTGAALEIDYTFGGANLQGARTATYSHAIFSATSSASNAQKDYTAHTSRIDINASEGGTNTGSGAKGSAYGENIVAAAESVVLSNWGEFSGMEIDISIASGSTIRGVEGMCINKINNDVRGVVLDAAYIVSGNGSCYWNNPFAVSDYNGNPGISSIGTVLGHVAAGNVAQPWTAALGVDFGDGVSTGFAFGTAAFRSRGFQVNPTGGISVGTTSDPGAGMIYTNAATFMTRTKTSWSDGSSSHIGTMTNAPAATNPTKWIPVDDNGTTRYIPAW
jgi:hypothetical protein